ncbi:MAG: hypothetical protein KBD14_01675 [Candidatus Pacebacteria bacterium]|jgi:FKBP-type peptidyl-prolyl cis-trans isomerase (trigger factor)|nr:hypothetical protein [Candidatus Paceibacterota bacterium]
MTKKINLKINKLPKSLVEIEGEIEADIFEGFYDKALKNIGEHVEFDGFRKGKVPENILISKVPESSILEEMAQLAISEEYPKILAEVELDVISQPNLNITKLARKNPLGFKITATIMPEVDLGDYKKTSKEVNNEKEEEIQVTDEEVENTILDIRRSRAPKVDMTKMTEEDIKKIEENKDSNLPEFNDEFVRALGPFENTEDFKEKLKENLKLEKTNQAREKKRLKIVEKILEDTKVEVPEILTNMEVDKILARMESDIANMGMQFEEYLKHLNKTREDLFKEFTPDGEKKAKLGLILNKIAKVESIVADAEEVEKEVAHIMEHYAGADKDQVRIYAENILTNEKIFKFLEALK